MRLRTFILAILLGAFGTSTQAQDYDLGVFGGVSTYRGDFTPTMLNGLKGTRPAFGGLYRYNMHPNFSLRASLNIGYIAGYDALWNDGDDDNSRQRRERNLSFHSPVVELSGTVEWNIMKYIAGSRRHRFAPYLFAGIGLTYTEPKTWSQDDRYALRKLPTEPNKSYSPVALAIPFGGGLKFNIKGDWTLGIEAGPRLTFTDYLDDLSTTYNANYSDIPNLSNRSGKPVTNSTPRGSAKYNDWYFFGGITLYKTIRPFRCR